MGEKILSISIAAFNVNNYLRKTLNSLEIRDINKLEIIIVNDGSTDSTIEIANDFKSKFPQSVIVIDKENAGYGSTINSAVKIASGKYFKQLDGDDWYVTQNLGGFISFLEGIDSDLIVTPYYKCYENEHGGTDYKLQDCHDMICRKRIDISDVNIVRNLLMHELTIKTELIKSNNIKISENCFYTDNEYAVLPLLHAKSIAKYEEPIYCYRLGLGEQSVSLNGMRKHYKDTIKVCIKIYESYEKEKTNLPKSVLNYMQRIKLISLTRNVYISHMILDKPLKHKRELIHFDKYIKYKYPDLYELTMTQKLISYPRKTNFIGYSIWCKYELKKFIKENMHVV